MLGRDVSTAFEGRWWHLVRAWARILLIRHARGMVLTALAGAPDRSLDRAGTSRQALYRDIVAYFHCLELEATLRRVSPAGKARAAE
jgi:hypothetical protein